MRIYQVDENNARLVEIPLHPLFHHYEITDEPADDRSRRGSIRFTGEECEPCSEVLKRSTAIPRGCATS